MVKSLPTMRESWVQSLEWEDPLEEGMATHSSILAWRMPMDREAWRLQSTGLQRVRHDWAIKHTAVICLSKMKSLEEQQTGWIASACVSVREKGREQNERKGCGGSQLSGKGRSLNLVQEQPRVWVVSRRQQWGKWCLGTINLTAVDEAVWRLKDW